MTYTPGFYVFEGLDGSGKSTLCRLLLDRLVSKGVPCISFAEPTKYESGIFLRRFLSGEIELSPEEQIRAFLDDRAVSLERNILPALREKKIVLLDRYMYSTAAYQAGKQSSASEILRRNLDRGFPEPISVFYLELSPETALSRLQSRNEKTERFETLSVLRKISEAYEEILPANTIRLDAKLAPERLVELAEERISY